MIMSKQKIIESQSDTINICKERQTAGAKVLQMLLDKIERGEYTSGQPIKESVLAQSGNWSRNAVREAMSQLVGWDILEYTPYCGYRMREYTLQDLLEMYELREAIEPLAARRFARLRPTQALNELALHLKIMETLSEHKDMVAYRRADLDFHLCIVSNCGNRLFSQKQLQAHLIALFFLNRIQFSEAKYQQYSTLRHFTNPPTHEEFDSLNIKLTVDMHRSLFDSIYRGDAENAERLCREHAANLVKNIESFILYYPEMAYADLIGFDHLLNKRTTPAKRKRTASGQPNAGESPVNVSS